MKLEKTAVFLEERDLLELETIVQDGDRDAALQFLHRLRHRIEQTQLKKCGPVTR